MLFTGVDDRLHPCSLVKCGRDGNEWGKQPEALAVKYSENEPAQRFKNAFLLEGGKILLVTEYSIFIFGCDLST